MWGKGRGSVQARSAARSLGPDVAELTRQLLARGEVKEAVGLVPDSQKKRLFLPMATIEKTFRAKQE
jgi:hypothetical protein